MSDVPVILRPGASLDSANFASTKSVTAVTTIGISVVSFANETAAGVAIPKRRSGEFLQVFRSYSSDCLGCFGHFGILK